MPEYIEREALLEKAKELAGGTAMGVIKRQDAEIERLQEKLAHSTGVDNTKENGYFPFD